VKQSRTALCMHISTNVEDRTWSDGNGDTRPEKTPRIGATVGELHQYKRGRQSMECDIRDGTRKVASNRWASGLLRAERLMIAKERVTRHSSDTDSNSLYDMPCLNRACKRERGEMRERDHCKGSG